MIFFLCYSLLVICCFFLIRYGNSIKHQSDIWSLSEGIIISLLPFGNIVCIFISIWEIISIKSKQETFRWGLEIVKKISDWFTHGRLKF